MAYNQTGLAKASLATGILSMFIGPITAIPGIIIGHMARSRAVNFPHEFGGGKMALTGLLLNYLSLITVILFLFAAYSLQQSGMLAGLLDIVDPSKHLSEMSNGFFAKYLGK